MNEGDVGSALRLAMMVILKLGGPLLLTALVVGMIVALLQAITQVNEAALTFVPKVVALCVVLTLLGPFMMATMGEYMRQVFDGVIAVGGS